MDSKRKANGAATPDSDDRAAKRRKLAESFDLSKGESRESTTAYGLSLVDQIRRTADKSGRRVAGYFETLPPREGNADYYRRTRMPISLETIEEKLQDGEFQNLSELESFFKRMISNAKEWFPRSSSTFDDAERVRKAVSNYMTKTNPAYQTRGYQAVPTPLPPGDPSQAEAQIEGPDEHAEGEDDEVAGEDEEDGEADGDDSGTASRKRSIILKRRGPGRSARNSLSTPQETPRKATSTRPDHQYEDVPYKGLNFQQAQEKLVEEMLRHKEPEYDNAYFEPFVNLPPRALKDYYKMIQEPLSLKKLQKMVKGVQGRNDATGVSEFKNWAQMDEKAKLLWDNAYYYNEEGSDICELAQELEKFFQDEFKRAQVVPEPAQPKIKLKVGQQAEQPASAKKITIHVGNSRGGSVDSPAPQTGQSVDSPAPGPDGNGVTGNPPLAFAAVDKARSVSASAASPSPSIQPPGFKGEDARMSPAVRPPSVASGQMAQGMARPPYPAAHAQPQFQPVPAAPMDQKRLRRPGKGIKDALMTSLRLEFHKHGQNEPNVVTVLPDAKDMQQSATVNLPADYSHVTMVAALPDFLQDRQYNLWALCDRHPLKASAQPIPNQLPQDRVFEAMLHPGLNMLEAHLVAAIPRSERVLGEDEVELEIFTVFVNVMRN